MRKLDAGELRLPFPTKPLFINGIEAEEYIIPEDKRTLVLRALYMYPPIPSLDEERFDPHSGKKFRIGEFRVTRECGRNRLVSPYYEEGGGTATDWLPVEEDDWAEVADCR